MLGERQRARLQSCLSLVLNFGAASLVQWECLTQEGGTDEAGRERLADSKTPPAGTGNIFALFARLKLKGDRAGIVSECAPSGCGCLALEASLRAANMRSDEWRGGGRELEH